MAGDTLNIALACLVLKLKRRVGFTVDNTSSLALIITEQACPFFEAEVKNFHSQAGRMSTQRYQRGQLVRGFIAN
jgi:hypothetical protein